MDTLLEANKHASLMRRRDQPRQFPISHLHCKSNITPRSFGWLRTASRPIAVRSMPLAASAKTRINSGSGQFASMGASGGLANASKPQPRLEPRATSTPRRPVIGRARAGKMTVALLQAPFCRFRSKLNGSTVPRRSFVMLAKPSRSVLIPKRAFRSLSLAPLGRLTGRRAQRIKSAAKVGRALRVSGSAGFRLPALSVKKPGLPAPAPQGLKWPEAMVLLRSAREAREFVPYPAEQDFPIATPRLRGRVDFSGKAGLPSAEPVPLAAAPRASQGEQRNAPWRTYAGDSQPVIRDSGLHLGQTASGSNYLAVRPAAAAGPAAQRVAQARFESPDHSVVTISYPWNSSR